MRSGNNSAEFYDNYLQAQIKSGINERIVSLYKRTKKLGLNNSSSVLEIGAGIGAMTFLLTRKVKRGLIEATDISPKSIDYLNQHLSRPNLVAYSGDILDLVTRGSNFDFILLFDVLEHIPIEHHLKLFTRIAKWMHPDSKLLINIPNPDYIVYDQQYHPEILQEIDQPIKTGKLSSDLEAAGLDIIDVETYNIWARNDYRFFIVQTHRPFEEQLIQKDRNFFQKGIRRVQREWRNLKWRFP